MTGLIEEATYVCAVCGKKVGVILCSTNSFSKYDLDIRCAVLKKFHTSLKPKTSNLTVSLDNQEAVRINTLASSTRRQMERLSGGSRRMRRRGIAFHHLKALLIGTIKIARIEV